MIIIKKFIFFTKILVFKKLNIFNYNLSFPTNIDKQQNKIKKIPLSFNLFYLVP